MHDRTRATLDQLEHIEWFRSVGKHDTSNAIVLSSWSEAIEHCKSDSWQDLLQEAQNQYFDQIWRRDKEFTRKWNSIVDEVKPITTALVERKTLNVVKTHQLPKIFLDTVNWDILHLAMESEYADVYPPGFFASQAYWYVQGHFPCGWKGDFPKGKLIIY